MSMIARMARAVRASVNVVHPRDPAIASIFGFAPTASGMHVTPDTAERLAAVYTCIRILSESSAALPLRIYKRRDDEGKDVMRDHAVAKLLRRPNPWQTEFDFREMIVGHKMLRGNFYARKLFRGDGSIEMLIPMHPDRVRVAQLDEKAGRRAYELVYEYTAPGGEKVTLLADEVFHVRLGGDLIGRSPIEVVRETFGLAMAERDYAARLFGNSAQPKGALKIPAVIKDDKTIAQIRDAWERRHKGPENAHRLAILEGGMEWQAIGMTAEDSQFIEGRKLSRSEIFGIFRVPPHMGGDLERSTNNNIEHQGLEFSTGTMLPLTVRVDQAIERDLIGDETGEIFAEHNLDGLLRGDIKSRYFAYSTGIQWGIVNPDECRAKENMNPRPGGDVYLRPLNMTDGTKPIEPPNDGGDPAADPAVDQKVARAVALLLARGGRRARNA